ncbi:MAG TPA: ribbon-helix-helix protein, CopG family [Kiritimatiellia bacterium]|nr:ribbon-helix-helix protein, CopG family [Kiritimatiellia bacterium]
MKTTLNIDDDLMRAVKVRAAQTDRTITDLVEEALRHTLAKPAKASEAETTWQFPESTFAGRPYPGVVIHDRKSVYDIMDGIK